MQASRESATGNGWLNLWQLVQHTWPRTCRIVRHPPPAPMARAKRILLDRDPTVQSAAAAVCAKVRGDADACRAAVEAIWTTNPDCARLLEKEVAERQLDRVWRVRYLTRVVAPDRVRQLLARGGYEVVAQRDGQPVSLSPRDLIACQVDFEANALVDGIVTYVAVRVRARTPSPRRKAGEGGMVAWLTQLMWDQPTKPMTKRAAHSLAVRSGQVRLSARGFDRAWALAVEASGAEKWSEPGRRG